MSNNLNINVSKNEFMEKPQKEQNWMLFEAIYKINKEGCGWAQKREKKTEKKSSVIAAITGFIGGATTVIVNKLFFLK